MPAEYRRSDQRRKKRIGKADVGHRGESEVESDAQYEHETGCDAVYPSIDTYEALYAVSAKSVLGGRSQESGPNAGGCPGGGKESERAVCACPADDRADRRQENRTTIVEQV